MYQQMSKRNFLVCCAKSVFVFATVVMASVALSSCSEDDKDENKTPDIPKQSIVINDKVKKVEKAVFQLFQANGKDCYTLHMYMPDESKDWLMVGGTVAFHNGRLTKLTEKEEASEENTTPWLLKYFDEATKSEVINVSGNGTTCATGTMKVDFNPEDGKYNVTISNLTITDENGKLHKLDARVEGTAIPYQAPPAEE